ncbi:MAG: spore coat protein CotH, partial [Clostridiales bacterium]|nr:spore coat protein CotH [Clostridiales bacterium]
SVTPAPVRQNTDEKAETRQQDNVFSRWNRDSGRQEMNFGGFGGFGMGSSDVKLQYIDDDPKSYTNIFNNAKTDITAADQSRLIASLKALGEGDLSVVDQDAVIRYMAVHNFLCNGDSYTGQMVHNYYLYEEDGVMAMIPWDYNLAYGGFSAGNATSTVNAIITNLVSNGSADDRPMAGWIMNDGAAMEQYLNVYRELIQTVFDSGWFDQEIDRVIALISPYVEKDPTSFCTYEEFETAAAILKSFCLKRAESVAIQLNGEETQVDASELNLTLMGSMGGGGGNRGGNVQMPGGGFDPASAGKNRRPSAAPGVFPMGDLNAGVEQPTAPAQDGGVPAEAKAPNNEGNAARFSFENTHARAGNASSAAACWIWLAVCTGLLIAGLFFALLYRSKR